MKSQVYITQDLFGKYRLTYRSLFGEKNNIDDLDFESQADLKNFLEHYWKDELLNVVYSYKNWMTGGGFMPTSQGRLKALDKLTAQLPRLTNLKLTALCKELLQAGSVIETMEKLLPFEGSSKHASAKKRVALIKQHVQMLQAELTQEKQGKEYKTMYQVTVIETQDQAAAYLTQQEKLQGGASHKNMEVNYDEYNG